MSKITFSYASKFPLETIEDKCIRNEINTKDAKSQLGSEDFLQFTEVEECFSGNENTRSELMSPTDGDSCLCIKKLEIKQNSIISTSSSTNDENANDFSDSWDSCKNKVEERRKIGEKKEKQWTNYNFFVKEKIVEVSKQYPKKEHAGKIQIISGMWKELSEKEKSIYRMKAHGNFIP